MHEQPPTNILGRVEVGLHQTLRAPVDRTHDYGPFGAPIDKWKSVWLGAIHHSHRADSLCWTGAVRLPASISLKLSPCAIAAANVQKIFGDLSDAAVLDQQVKSDTGRRVRRIDLGLGLFNLASLA